MEQAQREDSLKTTQGKADTTHYVTMTGQDIHLSPSIVKKYLVSGDASKVTSQEVMMFIAMCKFQKLNPFLREAYLIKYGNEKATFVTGKETFLKRAAKHPHYRGHKTGVDEECKVAWAEVYVKDFEFPIRVEVDYDEYVGKKKGGTATKMWKSKPKTMLKKCALVQALREAFPEDFGGMYSPEEINDIHEELSEKPVDIDVIYIDEDQVERLNDLIEDKGACLETFLNYMGVESLGKIVTGDYMKAVKALEAIEVEA